MRPHNNMKRIFTYLFILVSPLLWFAATVQEKKPLDIYLIGDSTMANKPDSPDVNPERGWGQLLHLFFKDQVTIHNHAVNGRSSKSFIGEGRWQTVLDSLKPGDYVFIQFGHNDQKDKDPKRYTNPWTGYRKNLEKFVDESRAKGAVPIILSSIIRRKFNDHGTLVDTHGPYPFVASVVAKDKATPFIDMQWLTEDFIQNLGEDKSTEIYLWVEPGEYERFPDGKIDNTHLSLKGATTFAGLVAEDIRRQDLPLKNWLKD